jgi:eukaryotic-like serine/threonine-protein kinase
VTATSRCPQCGTVSAGAGERGLCPACLLDLALDTDANDEPDDDASFPGPVYRVLTVLSSERDRTTYLAEQDGTQRMVTLDVVRISPHGDADALAGCRERLRALVRWRSRGAAHVIDGRVTSSGEFCVVSVYVKGQRLDRYCAARQLAPAECARIFSAVCDTMADAHQNRVCHGRLRPDLVVAAGSGDDARPIVLGFSVTPGRAPSVADDIAGLETVARAMGWRGAELPRGTSVDAVREAVCQDWPGAGRDRSKGVEA